MGREAFRTTSPRTDPMRKSLVERAKKRVVVDGKSPDRWVVKGIKSLGDKYDEYLVIALPDGTYKCDCHTHGHGETRERKTCSHVTATLLYRDGKLERQVDGFVPYTPPTNEWEVDFKESKESGTGEGPRSPLTSRDEAIVSVVEVEEGIPISTEADEVGEEEGLDSPFPLPSSISISPSDPPMPAKFTAYQHEQWPTILAIMEAYEAGFKAVLLDAPTGSGKTLIAESVRRLLGVRGIYTCTTKTLQDQVMNPRDFGGFAKVIKGRRNYPTLDNPTATADDCTKSQRSLPACERCPGWTADRSWRTDKTNRDPMEGQQTLTDLGGEDDEVVTYHCTNCHPWFACPYEKAKREAGMARLAVLNTAYFLSENAFVKRTPFRNWPLVILDEADRLEEELMRFVEVEIGPRVRKQLGVGLPLKKTVDEEWVRWLVEEVTPAIEREIKNAPQLATSEADLVKRKKALSRLKANVRWLVQEPAPTTVNPAPNGAKGEPPEPVLKSGWVYCADTETEILTEGGWKRHHELSMGDRVLTLDPTSQAISWAKLEAINIFPYEGQLVHWSSNRVDALTTEDHRWLSPWGFRTTKEIVDSGRYVQLAGGDPRQAFERIPSYPDEMVELAGWVLTEGWMRPGGSIEISQSVKENPGHCERIAELCAWLREQGFHVRDQLQKQGTMRRWYLSVDAGAYLSIAIPNKELSPDFILSLTVDQARLLFDVLMDGDGYYDKGGSRYWSQQDQGRIDGFQMLSALLGIRTRSRVSDYYNGSEIVAYRTQGAFTRSHQFTREDYSGEVWCPTVATGTWMARRNGVTYWTGNTGYEKKEEKYATVTFKPVEVAALAQQFLWKHGQRFLIMSASFVGAEETARELGLDDGEWTVITMPSTFPVLSRPIIPVDVARVTAKTKDESYPLIARSIARILERHPDERILIHTVSYDLGKQMVEHLSHTSHRSRLVTYNSAVEREDALKRYLDNPSGVLLAPSFDRGVDLPKDDCRVIIVPKVPYGNLGDKQISTRAFGTGRAGKIWYKRRAIQTLCQMTGRGMRSADDSCTTYILDSEFSKLFQENRRMFPKWWAEAIVWDRYDPKWRTLTVTAEGLA